VFTAPEFPGAVNTLPLEGEVDCLDYAGTDVEGRLSECTELF